MFILLLANSNLYSVNDDSYSERDNEITLKRAGYWEIGPIEIDDSDPTKNWLITKATYDWCSGSGTVNDPYLIENVTINGGGSSRGMYIIDSSVHFVIRNCTIFSTTDSGINLWRTQNGQIINNSFSNVHLGLRIDSDCSHNLILDNFIQNSENGIRLSSHESSSNYNSIINNTIINNSRDGIALGSSQDGECNYNNIWNNTINNNGYSGMTIRAGNIGGSCNYNNIKWNRINYNGMHGIALSLWKGTNNYNQIIENNIIGNDLDGISLLGDSSEPKYCENNLIEENIIYNNTNNGISLSYSNNNEISSNNITSNNLYGILSDTNSNNNDIYNNTFINNTVNALDSGTGNKWDFGSLGNYWDDYGGVDANDDGIGDTPYDVPPTGGSEDNYPIWEDGDDLPPNIIINSPSINDAFGVNAPTFDITINDASPINSTWYTIDGGTTNYNFSGLTGTVNQTAWDSKGTEIMTLRFYANDSLGHVGFNEVTIWKDVDAPQITINNPTPNQLCGIDAPGFSLTIIEPNILTKLYSLNGRPNITFTTHTEFDQTEWDNIGNGTVSITFYIIDKAGNTNSSEVTVRKDAIIPDIIILSPIQDEVFKSAPPEFNITIIEEDLVSTWYTIESIAGTFPFTGETGTIDQDAWSDVLEGQVTITFYAIDRAGNIGSESVLINKSVPSQQIPGYRLFFLLGILTIAVLIVSKRTCKKRLPA